MGKNRANKTTTINKEKENIEGMFDNIAPTYDRLNHTLSLGVDKGWRKKLVKQLIKEAVHLKREVAIVDLACGTGDLTIMLSKKCAKKNVALSTIRGVDLSANMLSVAKKKVLKEEITNIVLEKGDIEHLEIESSSADFVTIAFGIRNVEHLDLGLKEISRVLSDKGIAYILEFSKPSNVLIGGLFKIYFNCILPFIGRLISKDKNAYIYLPNSVNSFPFGKEFENIIQENGFRNVSTKKLSFGIASLYIARK